MKFKSLVIINLFILLTASWAIGKIIQQLSKDERNAIESIAIYPAKKQAAILEVASHPEVLVRMKNMRKNTEAQFKILLENIPEDDQNKLFNLSRFPELIEGICKGNVSKNAVEMDKLLVGYEKEIKEQAIFANQKYFRLLTSIHFLYFESQQAFEDLLNKYPIKTQEAFRELIKLPEILNALTENMNSTILLGDIYKNDPSKLQKDLDSISVIVAEQKTKELNDWEQSLKENPEALREYEQASKEFAKDQGFNESDYTTYEPEKRTEVEIRYVYQPYPYWFGYPWWYPYECWYPYPLWYHRGYYYGPANTIVFVGFPTLFYMHWHFHHHSHFYYYPHFTNHAVKHYYGHRKTRSSITTTVRNWEKKVQPELPKNWLYNNENRVARIKEYGKFKMDYQTSVQKKNGKVLSQRDYLKYNAGKYPTISPVLKERSAYSQPPQKRPIPPIRKTEPQIKGKTYPTKKYTPQRKETNKLPRQNKRPNQPITQPKPQIKKPNRPSRKYESRPKKSNPVPKRKGTVNPRKQYKNQSSEKIENSIREHAKHNLRNIKSTK